ncbi:MAG: TSUP family transporter, partial [Betaproteobacteria bacterium]
MERAIQGVARWISAGSCGRGALALITVLVAIASARMLAGHAADGAVAAVVLLAALVSSIAGFAFAALAGSALAYLRFDPVQAVMTMALCSIAIQSYAVWQLRASIRWRALGPMLAAGAMATPLGVVLLIHIDAELYAAVLGAIVTCYGGHLLLR